MILQRYVAKAVDAGQPLQTTELLHKRGGVTSRDEIRQKHVVDGEDGYVLDGLSLS